MFYILQFFNVVILHAMLMMQLNPNVGTAVDAYNLSMRRSQQQQQQQQYPMNGIRKNNNRHRQVSLGKLSLPHSYFLEKMTFPSPNSFLSLRGGSLLLSTTSDDSETDITTTTTTDESNVQNDQSLQQKSTKASKIRTTLLSLAVGIPIAFLAYQNRHQLFNKQYLQDKVLHTLQQLHSDQDPWRGILYYILGMTIWEALGLSTIPVETAAGMAFGSLPRSIVASLTGKILGASTAFCVGRYVLQRHVRNYLKHNTQFQLLEQSLASQPFITAMVMKYSCIPELFKNCGSSLLLPISFPTFVAVTFLHGGTFTCVWSWLGHDTALRLLDATLPPNRALQLTMAIVMTLGMLASPIVMAWFFRDLQQKQQQSISPNTSSTLE
jgi:uncharacterized membrane protein YdjX (TVP38/TMEM64 family)